MTDNKVKEIEDLVKIVSKLKSIGPKTAQRIVLHLINNREELIKPLTNTLAQVYKNVVRCNTCGNLKSSNSNCICSSNKYDQICVVENLADMFVIEITGVYKGSYHILGGTLPAFEGQKSGNGLLIESLIIFSRFLFSFFSIFFILFTLFFNIRSRFFFVESYLLK